MTHEIGLRGAGSRAEPNPAILAALELLAEEGRIRIERNPKEEIIGASLLG
jgi:hypothetical protein